MQLHPYGIKAMKSMQEDNKDKKVLTNEMATFIVLNTASIQIIPTTVIAIRSSLGAQNPTSIIVPVWIATVCAAIAGIVATKVFIKLGKWLFIRIFIIFIKVFIINNKKVFFKRRDVMKFIDFFSNVAMPFMIIVIVLYGVIERKKVFDIF